MARPKKPEKKVTRYTYDDIKEPRTPETGHTMLMDDEYQVVRVSMDNGWKKALNVGKLDDEPETVAIDMDPLIDPLLLWAGKKSTVDVPVLPLQRNEIVSESRIRQIVDRARRRASEERGEGAQMSLTFHELEKEIRDSEREKRVEFYTHHEGWRNKLICGDSLQVMQSLMHYEGLRGKVQMIYIDPPYGISFNSNFQQRVDSTRNEQGDSAEDVVAVRAFRDTWTLGVHSYLSYLQERLYVTRELLADSGSVFVQIGEENVHLVRSLLDEVFGEANACRTIAFQKTSGAGSGSGKTDLMPGVVDFVLWYAKNKESVKYNALYRLKALGEDGSSKYTYVETADGTRRPMNAQERATGLLPEGARAYRLDNLTSSTGVDKTRYPVCIDGREFRPGTSVWKTGEVGMRRLIESRRVHPMKTSLSYVRYIDDFPAFPLNNFWGDIGGIQSRSDPKVYVVQTATKAVERCMLMTTDPGDLVFDPTCGSGTTAVVAEARGRRWVTCDVARVAINVARNRLLGMTFPHYQLMGSSVADGFRYETVQRVTLKSIANDLEPEIVPLVDRPLVDSSAARVVGPYEVLTLGRYAAEDWQGMVVSDGEVADYVSVIARLYRRDASTDGATGFLHAIVDDVSGPLGISIGPISGRVTAKQVADAAQDAVSAGIRHVDILGWAFEANVGEIKSKLESRGKLQIGLVMIRPDTLMSGLKVTSAAGLFSPLALPEVACEPVGSDTEGKALFKVVLKGVGVFDRKTQSADFKAADSGYVSAWYLDEDYDGDCFVDCQMFFDFKKHPNLKSIVNEDIDGREFSMRYESDPFSPGHYRVAAVKVVDVYGNESTVTIPLDSEA